jgi:V8-like Glu-specific endopeptidase
MAGLTIALSLLPGVASAATQPAASDGNVSTVARTADGKAVDSPAAVAAIASYWTPERMRAAIPADVHHSENAPVRDSKPNGPVGSIDAVGPSAPAVAADRQAAGGPGVQVTESRAVGKVYYHDPAAGVDRVCSAATVASGKARLVTTAGHCVHGGPGQQWMTNWAFVPQYRWGAQPYGMWFAINLTSRTAWINNGNRDEDMGIAIIGDRNGQRIVHVVGGNGLRWNWGYSVYVTILGYPAAPPFPGELQYYCQGTTWSAHWFSQQVRANCNMTGGSSGGPWLMEYNDASGLGYTNSVVSHRHDDPNTMDGPYFDDDIKSLYDYAESLSP